MEAQRLKVSQTDTHYVVRVEWEPQIHAEISTLNGAVWNDHRHAWMIKKTPNSTSHLRAIHRRYSGKRTVPVTGYQDPLWPHQHEALVFACDHPSVLLDMYMATGKTRTALEMVRVYEANCVLVLGPLQAGSVWRTQIERYCKYEQISLIVNSAQSVAKRAVQIQAFCGQQAAQIVRFVFVNYEAAWRPRMRETLLGIPWDMIIADECHRMKAPGSRISLFMDRLGPHVPYRVGLSGTPLPRSILDAYGTYRFLQPSIFGRQFKTFKDRYVIEDPFTREEISYPRSKEFREKYNLIRHHVPKEALQIDQPLFTLVPVALQSKVWALYRQLERDFYATLDETLNIDAPNVLVKYLRLQQIESGFVTDEGQVTELPGGDVKRQMLQSFLEDFPPGEPLVIFARFRHEIDQRKRCVEATQRPCYRLTGDHKEQEKWECDDGAVLAVNLGAGAEAIDLTHASYAVFYSLSLRLSEFEQAIARVNRPGQKQAPAVYFFLPEGPDGETTIGQRLYHAHKARRSLLDYLVEEKSLGDTIPV